MRLNFIQSPAGVLSSPGSLPGVAVRWSCCRRARRFLLPVLLLVAAAAPAHGSVEPTDLTATVGEGGVSLRPLPAIRFCGGTSESTRRVYSKY